MPGTLTISNISDGTNTGNATDMIRGSAKAWVNFDGSGAFSPNPSTTAIRASHNVSSITRSSTGVFQVNFTTNFADTKYSVLVSADGNTTTIMTTASYAVGSVGLTANATNFGVVNPTNVCVAIFR